LRDPALTQSVRGALRVGFGKIDEGLEDIEAVLATQPGHPEALYSKACAYSLKGDAKTAFITLQQAIAAYRPHRATAAADPHFACLREDPEYGKKFRVLTKR
jgi:hypothetical protein